MQERRQTEIGQTKVDIKSHLPRTCFVKLSGEIDADSAPRVTEFINNNLHAEEEAVVVNMENLRFMDSSGIKLLLMLAQKLGGLENIAVYKMPTDVRRIMDAVLDHHIERFYFPEELDVWLRKHNSLAA